MLEVARFIVTRVETVQSCLESRAIDIVHLFLVNPKLHVPNSTVTDNVDSGQDTESISPVPTNCEGRTLRAPGRVNDNIAV